MSKPDLSRIDHLIFGAPNLQAGIAFIRQKLGVSPTGGGRHPDFGTHNAVFRIGEHTYFEIIAPDPQQADQAKKIWMELDRLEAPGLIWWAARTKDMATSLQRAKVAGWDPGRPMAGSRTTTEGVVLNWQLSDPFRVQEDGVLPFLIDWGDSPHPTDNMPKAAVALIDFQLLHPQANRIRSTLASIGIHFPVYDHPTPQIRAGFAMEAGKLYL